MGGHDFFPASIFNSTNLVLNIFRITLYYLSIPAAAVNNETSYKILFRLISCIHAHTRVLCYLSVTRNGTWCVDTTAVVFFFSWVTSVWTIVSRSPNILWHVDPLTV
jgi:hypothetical protein